jgi:hypothetical protein
MIWNIEIADNLSGEVKEDAEKIREILNEYYTSRPSATINSTRKKFLRIDFHSGAIDTDFISHLEDNTNFKPRKLNIDNTTQIYIER